MMQSKTPILAVFALVIGFAGGFVLRPLIMPPGMAIAGNPASVIVSPPAAPRSAQYFAANLDEARQIVARCQTGSVRGDECVNAEQAILAAEGRDRLKRFMGKRP
ncbi:MAG: hypothetical protein WC816_08125 [Sphingomonas sp.]|jgi:hypothetical protein